MSSCSISDIRNDYVKTQSNTSERARQILSEMQIAHGVEHWNKFQTYSVAFQDEFYGLIGSIANPFPNNRADVILTYTPGEFTGKASFVSGKWQGKTWGYTQNRTYEEDKEGNLNFEENSTIKFWVPTYQYFLELPARITEADQMAYAGTDEWNGRPQDLVLVSWKSLSPQKDIDQYVLWIDQETHRITLIEYTIREIMKSAKGCAFFEDYETYGGILLPSKIPVKQKREQADNLHQMSINAVTFDSIPTTQLAVEFP
ncbi:hypothetical protein [Pontibacter sp. G13]|uniref:hypothetical protein n=1 Tax=Pontibacter sp. G13 TaxID=3074898 RepID=UPI00288B1AFC|nr:hypothetical protein [Pontibacter sp. G13]WNJ16334.1 hypothetical protein RJD25_15830 [Pontibacter sp. G13]